MFLEKLCNSDGVSGNETEVRELIKKEITPYADEVITDSMGNLLVKKYGKSSEKTVMLSCHMDEVGFIISGFTKEGYLEFKTVGGIDTRVILSKKVRIGKDKIKGIIGIKAIHLTKKSERESVPKVNELYIDIGAKDEEDAKKYVKLGDYASFDTKFEMYGESTIKAKAIDDRAGCYVLAELLKKDLKYDTWFCFCVQEEVGLRGAKITAARIKPDIALVIEATTAADVADSKEHEKVTIVGGGAAISFMDRRTIVPKELCTWLYDQGGKNDIKVQYKTMVAGGNDAGIIHITDGGIKTATVSVPCRYLHSPAGVASIDDINSVLKLSKMFIDKIDDII